MKACVVDDDPTSRILLSDFLEDQGLDIVSFDHPDSKLENGMTLQEEILREDTKILIMDIRFGRDVNGIKLGLNKVAYFIEDNILTEKCKILFISQFGKESIGFNEIEKILKNKKIPYEWFDKPVNFVKLEEIISEVIA